MQDDERMTLLQLNPQQLSDVAVFCNHYSNIKVSFEVLNKDEITTGNSINAKVTAEYLNELSESLMAPFFPQKRQEAWWIVIGVSKTDEICAIKRIIGNRKFEATLDFTAPSSGIYDYTLYLESDCYMGCDHEYAFSVTVKNPSDIEICDN